MEKCSNVCQTPGRGKNVDAEREKGEKKERMGVHFKFEKNFYLTLKHNITLVQIYLMDMEVQRRITCSIHLRNRKERLLFRIQNHNPHCPRHSLKRQ
jgi:hypothetical protein